MTMTEGTAPKPPSAVSVDLKPSHTMYGFETDTWIDQPIPEGPGWFGRAEKYRRNANEHAYKQHGTQTNWNRYVNLGLFVFEDCSECDKAWSVMEKEPLLIHHSIWYNFMCHVDRELQVPDKLNAWATNISQPYLAQHDPTTLHETDTINFAWKDMPFMKDNMDVDNSNDSIPVQSCRRSKSPPNQSNHKNLNQSADTGVSLAPGFNPPPDELPTNYRPLITTTHKQSSKSETNKTLTKEKLKAWENLPPVSTVQKENAQEDNEYNAISKESNKDQTNKSYQGTKGKTNSRHTLAHSNVPTNDGTQRITIRWTPPDAIQVYETDKKKMNEAIHSLVKVMFPEDSGVLYRWESEDLMLSKNTQSVTISELRDYISPKVTLITPRDQMIFESHPYLTHRAQAEIWLLQDISYSKLPTRQT
jgi:hypothetical protein